MNITRHLYTAHCLLTTATVALFFGTLSCNRQPKTTHPLTKISTKLNTPSVTAPSANPAAVAQAIRATLAENASVKTRDTEP